MKTLLMVALASVLASGCAEILVCDSCPSLVQRSAATALSCVEVSSLPLDSSWKYRATGCNQTAFYRCSRRGVGACCRRVQTEEAARATFHPSLTHPGGPFPETTVCE